MTSFKETVVLESFQHFCFQIFLAKGNVPAKNYNFFMDILLDTIRGEIAVCMEKAYEKLSLKDAARMLYLPNEETAKIFGTKVSHTIIFIHYFSDICVLDKEMEVGQG